MAAEGISYIGVVGSLDDPGAILEAAKGHGINDFEGHLWVGSVLESFYLLRHLRGNYTLPDTHRLSEVGSPLSWNAVVIYFC